jgi:hypothetical protein
MRSRFERAEQAVRAEAAMSCDGRRRATAHRQIDRLFRAGAVSRRSFGEYVLYGARQRDGRHMRQLVLTMKGSLNVCNAISLSTISTISIIPYIADVSRTPAANAGLYINSGGPFCV